METSSPGYDAVVIVQARMGSSRLPGKMMADLCGRPLLWHILRRAALIDPGAPVVLATTTADRDDILARTAAAVGLPVERGPESDVLARFLQVLDRFPARWVVRICGDSPLFDPEFLGECLARARKEAADVVKFRANAPSLYQGGEVVSARALRWSRSVAPDDPLSREHVTAHALRHADQHPDELVTAHVEADPAHMRDLKLSVDTEADLARLQALYRALWNGEDVVPLAAAATWIAGPGAHHWKNNRE